MTEPKEKILIVDDEAAVRQLLHRGIAREGYSCYEAGAGEEALSELRNNRMALAILDIKLPGKSGTELLSEMKAIQADIAIIMLTATTDINIAIQCMQQGAYDYITKPFNLHRVALSIERALERRRLELENKYYQMHLEEQVEEQAKKIRASFLNAIKALVYALEAKDKYTSGHSQRVAEISVAIAKELSLPQDQVEKIRLAGLIHDIGKIGVKEAILNKLGDLTEKEYQHILAHCEIGEHILTPIVEDVCILKAVRHHHERYDSTGYPNGLSHTQISLEAKILAVADAYDALTSERAYRSAMSIRAACAEIERCTSTQFDPEVVKAFLRIEKTAGPTKIEDQRKQKLKA